MKHQFVKTENAERFEAAISAIEQRGALEAGWMLVTARPGEGKSTVVTHWVAHSGAVYLRAKVEWTPHYMMLELAQALDVDVRGKAKDLFGRVLGKIAAESVPIVIDEVEHALRDNASCLEQLRDLSDLTEIPVVLIGMEQAKARIARHMQMASRIGYICEFRSASLVDVRRACDQLLDVAVSDDVVMAIHAQADGRMRMVMNALARVEMTARRLRVERVEASHIKGIPLCEDWQSRVKHLRVGGGK